MYQRPKRARSAPSAQEVAEAQASLDGLVAQGFAVKGEDGRYRPTPLAYTKLPAHGSC